VSLSTLYKWSQPVTVEGNGRHNPLDQMARLVALTANDELLDWLCAQRGGRFVRRSELPALARQYKNRLFAEMEQFFKSVVKAIPGTLPSPAKRSGGPGCRHRRPDGRCGWLHARRN
jgi:hypothetical protein